eukprot:COSAG06_NODE_856_length_11920_cov_2.789358_5_plen_108_part_00
MVLVEGGGEAVVAQAGLERIHPLGRTIRMFPRLTQRRPAAGDCFNRGKLSTKICATFWFAMPSHKGRKLDYQIRLDLYETNSNWITGLRILTNDLFSCGGGRREMHL